MAVGRRNEPLFCLKTKPATEFAMTAIVTAITHEKWQDRHKKKKNKDEKTTGINPSSKR